MTSEWIYKITIWTVKGIKEYIVLVDLNNYEDDVFEYWGDGENEKQIFDIIDLSEDIRKEAKIYQVEEIKGEFINLIKSN